MLSRLFFLYETTTEKKKHCMRALKGPNFKKELDFN